jgi:hypothetical protein
VVVRVCDGSDRSDVDDTSSAGALQVCVDGGNRLCASLRGARHTLPAGADALAVTLDVPHSRWLHVVVRCDGRQLLLDVDGCTPAPPSSASSPAATAPSTTTSTSAVVSSTPANTTPTPATGAPADASRARTHAAALIRFDGDTALSMRDV